MRKLMCDGRSFSTPPHSTKSFVVLLKQILILLMILLPGILNSQDTLICDNGGFENGFLYYKGYYGQFRFGSNSCTPLDKDTLPIVYTEATTLPLPNRFEIVPQGTDILTGYDEVLFDEYSLRLNSPRSHAFSPNVDLKCVFQADVNRITKRFIVNEQNRNFTIWYLAVLGNPDGHGNSQPFFSIRCDLAPNFDLCFDGISFPAITLHPLDSCIREGEHIKTSNWSCHRFNIPKEHVGNMATLEIVAADCGQGVHMGYVYIDGICQDCDSSSYGSGNIGNKTDIIVSCDGDSITILGKYTTPTIDGFTILDTIVVPGFGIYGLNIDTTAKTFSFRIVKTDFQSPNPTCRDVIAYLKFKNSSGDFLPDVPTNAVEICEQDFVIPEVEIIIGDCNRNHPTNNVFSDDYYYVNFIISNADNRHWRLERLMDDPYPDESGRYFLKTDGYGNGTYNLGPFLIQEGSWVLTLYYGGCADTFQIIPPDYCSGCSALSKVRISNIQCNPATGNWSYDILIPGLVPPTGECWRIGQNNYQFNVAYTFDGGQVNNQDCKNVRIYYIADCGPIPDCFADLDICPPKPCNNGNYESCDLEVYFDGIHCIDNGNGNYSYTVEFNVSDAPNPCYKSFLPGNLNLVEGPFSNPLGPFNDTDRIFVIYSCGNLIPYTCECPDSGCYKVFKIHKPQDCLNREDVGGNTERSMLKILDELEIVPNPIVADEWMIRSKLEKTEFEIIDSSGSIILSGKFNGTEHSLNLTLSKGLYLLRYKNSKGTYTSRNFIKL